MSPKTIGCVAIPFEHLSIVLGFQVNSIKFVERDSEKQIIYLFHTDERVGTWSLPDESTVPTTQLNMTHFAPAWASLLRNLGWIVTPPPEENKYETDNM